ncbi:unnamed protein product [Kluyveromyces dobzhanskii CBS 2104]|uniref:WGS project CCBQ000000000 data, contig 00102 n=1 Tax=Kluyveromyces dobzhanskii CBS 2104 TaxID=1427455 RepID=A0A0A8L4V7_9SACH|nr:unnamed protein product [Kluyveromyces dobzhanskii CBS 2104]
MSGSLFSSVVPAAVSGRMDQFTNYVMSLPPHPHLSEYVLPFVETHNWVASKVILSHLHTVLYVAFGYHVLFLLSQWILFPPLASYRLSWDADTGAASQDPAKGKSKGKAKAKAKALERQHTDLVNQSAVRLVSWIQSLVVLYLSFEAISHNNSQASLLTPHDRVFGIDAYNVKVCVFAIGYFLWDIYISMVYSTLPFVLHGLISTVVYAIGLKPYINYYAGIFLMFELSNPFLNIRWFGIKYMPQLSKDCQTVVAKLSNVVQLVNNIALISMFFLARICWGFYQFYQLCTDFYAVRNDPNFLPLETAIIVVGNLTLDVLNLFWLSAMLSVAVRIIKKGGKVQDK